MEATLNFLCTSSNLWIPCMPSFAPVEVDTCTLGWSHACWFEWSLDHAALSLSLLFLWQKKILLDVVHRTIEWLGSIICMAAYLRRDNTARCPDRFKQTSDEFYPLWIAKHGGNIIIKRDLLCSRLQEGKFNFLSNLHEIETKISITAFKMQITPCNW